MPYNSTNIDLDPYETLDLNQKILTTSTHDANKSQSKCYWYYTFYGNYKIFME